MPTKTRLAVTPQLVIGIFLLLFGLLLTLDRLQLVAAAETLRFWPAALVVLGTWILAQQREGSGTFWGFVLILIGGWMLLNTLGIVRVGFWELFWPLAIVLLGTRLIMQALGPAGPMRGLRPSEWIHAGPTATATDGSGKVSVFAVLGGTKRASNDKPFRGGEMTAVMGGTQLDLRQATIAPGAEAVINVFAIMGGHEVWVPPAWTVVSDVMPVLGSVEDKRLPPVDGTPHPPNEAAPRLVLRGVVVMGGLTIKS